MNIKGTPFRLRPHSESESDAVVEESLEPHINSDQHPPDDSPKDVFDKPELKKLDRQLRLTQKDFDRFGYSDDCPKCRCLRQGRF